MCSRWPDYGDTHDVRAGSLLVWHMEYRPRSHPDHTTDQGISRPTSSEPVLAVGRRCFPWYTAATLILSSRDVRIFASVIYWEALLRFASVSLLVAYGFTYVGVVPTVLFAVTDFVWGLMYLIGLRRVTGRSQASLLFDRRV